MIIFKPKTYGFAGLCLLLGNTTTLAQGTGPAQTSELPIANEIIGSQHHVEVYVSEDAVQALYIRDAQFVVNRPATIQGGIFFTERNDIVGTATLLTRIVDPDRFPRWDFRVGTMAYGALLNEEDQDVFGLGLGGTARYGFATSARLGIAFGASYAPDILTFGEADNVADAFVRLEARVRDGLTAFVGYRRLEFDLPQQSDRELDDHAHVGIRWTF